MPGASIGQMKYEMPSCFGASGSVRAMRMPSWRALGERRPDLLAVDHPLVAVAHGPGAEGGEVGAGAGLAEELAPDLLAGEQREQVALLLLLACRRGRSSGRPSRCRSGSTGAARRPRQLLVDEELVDRVGVEPPRPRPVRRDVAGLGELAARRRGWSASQARDREAARVVVGRQLEVHRAATAASVAVASPTSTPTHAGLELRRRLGGRRRAVPGRARPGPGRPAHHVGASSTGGPTASPATLLDAGARAAGQGRPVPLQLPRVPRVDVRHLQGRPRAGQHQLPLRRRRARLPVGQRRRRRRRVPRHLRRPHRAHPRPGARGPAAGCGSTTAAARARTGPCPTRQAAAVGRRPGAARRGAAAATTSSCSTPAAPPACPRA